MTEHPFRKKLSKELFPVLRAEGFTGSGATLRRIEKPLINVFNIQAGTGLYADSCFINLGVHLDSLQMPGGDPLVSAERTREYNSLFRTRIDPPNGEPSWKYPDNEEGMNRLLVLIYREWMNQGHAFFERYVYPQSFEKRISDCNPVTTDTYQLVTNARIAMVLGDLQRATAFAQNVLNRLGVWEVFRCECLLLIQDAENAGYLGPAEIRKQLNWPV